MSSVNDLKSRHGTLRAKRLELQKEMDALAKQILIAEFGAQIGDVGIVEYGGKKRAQIVDIIVRYDSARYLYKAFKKNGQLEANPHELYGSAFTKEVAVPA